MSLRDVFDSVAREENLGFLAKTAALSGVGSALFFIAVIYAACNTMIFWTVVFLVVAMLLSSLFALATSAFNSEFQGARHRERRVRLMLDRAVNSVGSWGNAPVEIAEVSKEAKILLVEMYGKNRE